MKLSVSNDVNMEAFGEKRVEVGRHGTQAECVDV